MFYSQKLEQSELLSNIHALWLADGHLADANDPLESCQDFIRHQTTRADETYKLSGR